MNRFAATILVLLGVSLAPATALPQDFDPREYQSAVSGEPTRVMVLGTAHLSGAPEHWDPRVLEPLLDRLEAFAPDVITTEDQPGPTLTKIWAYRQILPEAAATYGGRALRMATEAGLGLDLDMPQAEASVAETMLDWPSQATPSQRRRLAALFAASGDPYSALVQWWHLPEPERVAGDGVTSGLVLQLNDLGRSRGESVQIAARLAVRLGLQRIYPADSQEEVIFTPRESDLFSESVFPSLVERFEADPILRSNGTVDNMTDGVKTLAEYRKLNSTVINLRSAEVEWLGVINRPSEEHVGRKRMAGWEVRNMRMAANIREASAKAPGGRVLVIVGAAHKVWLEAYLGMMADVEVVTTDAVLD